MTPSRRSQKLAAAQDRIRRNIEDLMISRALRKLAHAEAMAIRAWKAGRDPRPAWRNAIGLEGDGVSDLHKILIEAQVDAYRAGVAFAEKHLESPVKKFAVWASIKAFLRGIVGITSPEIAAVRVGYSKGVNKAIEKLAIDTQARLTDAMIKAKAADLPTQAGAKLLREAFEKSGVSGPTPYQVETVFRAQVTSAFQVANLKVESIPAVDDEIWGYEFVTAGDDRVRDSHAAMDGVRAPKDHPVWDKWTPPCAWGCRCIRQPIFKDENPTATAIPNVDPLEGGKPFPYNPQQLFEDLQAR